jgi:S-adenosylmethionine-diacylglycerol 3-amino-3-carboxypropyl transferase
VQGHLEPGASSRSAAPDTATEASARADFTQIRYAQCWEDVDILLDALAIVPGDVCLSIASAGDNSFSLLTRNPAKVIAVDLNPAQLACAELRKAAYSHLQHQELLQLVGSRPCDNRHSLYLKCRPDLRDDHRKFWDDRPELIDGGIGAAGKFERYFALFRTRVIPWIHTRRRIDALLAGGSPQERRQFYDSTWNSWRWRLLFKIFFSRTIMGRFGRDPAFFKYVEGSVSQRILDRSRHALTELNPADNPYLQWILTGHHTTALPHALREENFEPIRKNLDHVQFHLGSIEQYLAANPHERIDRLNLSDIFEYMSEPNYHALLDLLVQHANPKARLVYWNMLVPRSRPESMAGRLQSLTELSQRLFLADKAFFYSRFVVEEVI